MDVKRLFSSEFEAVANDKDFLDRFLSRIDKTGSCWLWMGSNNGRYGLVPRRGWGPDRILAHRVSWMIHNNKPIPDKLVVCHACDVPRCVNPNHLYVGSQSDNIRSSWERGERRNVTTRKLVHTDAINIRHLVGLGIRRADVAAAFGITVQHVASVLNWKAYKHARRQAQIRKKGEAVNHV